MINNGIFVSQISSLIPEIFKSLFKNSTDDVTNSFSTKINHKIKNISGNIELVLLKLGTSNVPQVRQNDGCCAGAIDGKQFYFLDPFMVD